MPQCAVIGWPGQTGQVSSAASSQTVKTKSISGAPGAANSFQSFEREGRVVVEPLQQLERVGMDLALRMRAGREGLELADADRG